MSTILSYLIRAAVESDVAACLELDGSYETEFVWQMSIQEEIGQWQALFKTERLPRVMQVVYPVAEERLRLALTPDYGFLVAASRDLDEVLGFVTMRTDPIHRIALVQDVLVSRPYRRRGIGAKLLGAARKWAKEHPLTQMILETQSKNYPSILFCQQLGFTFCGFNDQYFRNQDIALFFGQSLR